jgi:hypothetical protein
MLGDEATQDGILGFRNGTNCVSFATSVSGKALGVPGPAHEAVSADGRHPTVV